MVPGDRAERSDARTGSSVIKYLRSFRAAHHGLFEALLAVATYGLIFIFFAAMLSAFAVGLWDLVVWLTNADWPTTSFEFPLYAAIGTVFVGLIIKSIDIVIARMGDEH